MDIALFGSARRVDRLRDQVAEAARLGFRSFWMPQIFSIDALTAIAVIAHEIPEIRLGTAVVPTFPRHPMMLAQQALTVSQVSGGRLDLGIGVSHKPVVEGMWGMPFDKPVGHLRDYLSVLMPLLRGERVSHSGEQLTGRGEIDVPADTPPVYVAALGEQMLNVAGEMADGTLLWMTGPGTIAEHTVPTVRAAAAAAQRPTPKVIASAPVCLTDDVAGAREQAANEFVVYGQLPSYRAMLDREGLGGPEDLAIIGDEAAVAAGIARFAEAGVDIFAATVFGSDDERAATSALLASMRA